MFKKDKLITGVLLGLLVPVVPPLAVYLYYDLQGRWVSPDFMEGFSLFMLAVNGLLLRYFLVKREQDRIGRGIMMVTLPLTIVWVIIFQL